MPTVKQDAVQEIKDRLDLVDLVSESVAGNGTRGWTRLRPTGIRPRIVDKIHRLDAAGPELDRLYPKNSAASPLSGRRTVTPVETPGGVPGRDRRQG